MIQVLWKPIAGRWGKGPSALSSPFFSGVPGQTAGARVRRGVGFLHFVGLIDRSDEGTVVSIGDLSSLEPVLGKIGQLSRSTSPSFLCATSSEQSRQAGQSPGPRFLLPDSRV